MRARLIPWLAVLAALAALAGLGAACGDKKEDSGDRTEPPPPPSVTGLDAIPGGADVIVGVNVAGLRDSELVRGLVRSVLARDPALERRVHALLGACGIDVARDLESVMVATGATPSEAVMVVTGALDPIRVPACIGEAVRAGGGKLEQRAARPRPVWVTRTPEGSAGVWFAFGAPRTMVAAASEPWLQAALGDGDKATGDGELMGLVRRADRTAGLWAAGRVDPRLAGRLATLTGGAVKGPIRFMFGHLRVAGGVSAELGAVMSSAADATATAEFAREQLPPYAMVAQGLGLGGLVSNLVVEAEDDTVFLRLNLSGDQLKEVVSQIDRAAGGE